MMWVMICFVTIAIYGLLRKRSETEEKEGVPKGSWGWPLIGETLDFIASGYSSEPVSFMDKRKSRYGKVFKTHILGTPIIVSTDSEVNKVVLQNYGNVFIPSYPKSIRMLLGDFSILNTNGNLQKKIHAVIGSFLRSISFKERIAKDIENSIKHTLTSWCNEDVIYLQEYSKKITFEVLVKALLGIVPAEKLGFMRAVFQEFLKGLICVPIKFPGTRLYKSLKAKEELVEVVTQIVQERRNELEASNNEHPMPMDVVGVLLLEKYLPHDFISGNIVEMMIPGEETVPVAMTLTVKFLSDCPLALKQITEENVEMSTTKRSTGADITWNDYMSLQFTQNVISETLRITNIINGVWRKALKDVKIKGYMIPQGWCVLASFTSVHMDPSNYENPYQFNPWRWEKTEGAVNGNIYTPFGGGQRLCPGLDLSRLEIAIFLHHLVTNYTWQAKEDRILYFPTVRLKNKLPITVTPVSKT